MTSPNKLLVRLFVMICLTLVPPAHGDAQAGPPTLTNAEKQAGWKLLFDGSTTAGWRGLGMEGFPDNRWEIKDNCLHGKGGPGRTNDIITTRKYDNFELRFEWLCPTPPGNSGVKYRVQEKK